MSKIGILVTIVAMTALLTLGIACASSPTATVSPNAPGNTPTSNTGPAASPSTSSIGAPNISSTMPSSGTASYAYQQASGQQTGIWVTGTGKVSAQPDLAILTVGVQSSEKTVTDATSKASAAMNAIMSVLKQHNIADKDIQTQNYDITPNYQYVQSTDGGITKGTQVLIGYIVNNTITVKIRDLASVGSVIDDVANAGGDLTRINGVSFTIEDPTSLMNQAREIAVKDAMAKATQFASLTGVTLGKLEYIAETSSQTPVYRAAGMAAAAPSSAPTPISSGEMDIQVSVQAVFGIQ